MRSAADSAAPRHRTCPEPGDGYLPSWWKAGEIIRERCLDEGVDVTECETRAATARQHFVDADRNGGPWTVPGVAALDFGRSLHVGDAILVGVDDDVRFCQ